MDSFRSRFLGRRYSLTIEDTKEVLEVVPHTMEIYTLGTVPRAIVFSLYDKDNTPVPKLDRHVQEVWFEAKGHKASKYTSDEDATAAGGEGEEKKKPAKAAAAGGDAKKAEAPKKK